MDNSNTNRFKDKGNTIYGYLDNILVHCPKCSKKASLTKNGKNFWGDVELKCPDCHYYQKNRIETYDQEIKFFCSNCAEKVNSYVENVKIKKDLIKMKCPNCKTTNPYKPRYIKKEWVYKSDGNGDPFLNLPLWLSGKVKKNILWAYNYEHLQYIKGYVQAKLRTRYNGDYSTMVEKLPSWIKSEKNREDIIKRIEKLETK